MNEKELQDIEFEYAPFTDEGSQQIKALVAEVRRLQIELTEMTEDRDSENRWAKTYFDHWNASRNDVAMLRAALDKIMHELGVPQPGYLAPVANAYYIAEEALKGGAQ